MANEFRYETLTRHKSAEEPEEIMWQHGHVFEPLPEWLAPFHGDHLDLERGARLGFSAEVLAEWVCRWWATEGLVLGGWHEYVEAALHEVGGDGTIFDTKTGPLQPLDAGEAAEAGYHVAQPDPATMQALDRLVSSDVWSEANRVLPDGLTLWVQGTPFLAEWHGAEETEEEVEEEDEDYDEEEAED